MTRPTRVRCDSYNLSVAWLIQHTCDLTHSTYLWRDSYNIRAAWRIQTYVWHGSFNLSVTWLVSIQYLTCLDCSAMWDMTHYVRHDSSCETWLIMWDMTHFTYLWHDSYNRRVPWLIQYLCDTNHWKCVCVPWLICIQHLCSLACFTKWQQWVSRGAYIGLFWAYIWLFWHKHLLYIGEPV